MYTELEEITKNKDLENLLKELEWQTQQGEDLGGAICSHLIHKINLESSFAFTLEAVHISDIANGDIIIRSGQLNTVDNSYIKRNDLMGKTLFGDSYRLGTIPVLRAVMSQVRSAS